jgi:SAM-dependent methyltransferase
MDDPYRDGSFRWWHLDRPSPELLEAHDDGWLPVPGVVVDLGCGLGTETGYLAAIGWAAVGVDLSGQALRAASALHPAVTFAQADVLRLPLPDASADLLLDRGCFHYLLAADRDSYVREAGRVLRRGGRFLLRACLTSAGVPNGMDEAVIRDAFRDWDLAGIVTRDIESGTRGMPALVARLRQKNSSSPCGCWAGSR